jgi:hypothetical protein
LRRAVALQRPSTRVSWIWIGTLNRAAKEAGCHPELLDLAGVLL